MVINPRKIKSTSILPVSLTLFLNKYKEKLQLKAKLHKPLEPLNFIIFITLVAFASLYFTSGLIHKKNFIPYRTDIYEGVNWDNVFLVITLISLGTSGMIVLLIYICNLLYFLVRTRPILRFKTLPALWPILAVIIFLLLTIRVIAINH